MAESVEYLYCIINTLYSKLKSSSETALCFILIQLSTDAPAVFDFAINCFCRPVI